MAHRQIMKSLLLLTLSVDCTLAVSRSLQYFYTAITPGINFPEFSDVGQVDGQQFVYYDSNIRKYIPKTKWIQKNVGEDYWKSETESKKGQEELFKVNIDTAMKRFNHTLGVHTLQRTYGCELHDDGTVSGYDQLAYDGDDFISLDLKTKTWIAPNPQALITKNKWEQTAKANSDKIYLENTCIKWLKKYMSYGKETLERKDPPTSSVFQKNSPSPEVVCLATGFFPKEVKISWRKDGEDVNEDVELRETLPNQDGSFQKRIILKVLAEDLQKHKYTCVIQHSSLKEEMVVDVSERQILKGGGSGGGQTGIIIGVVVAAAVLIGLIVAGILVWKKKNSGFKRAPSSEGDSSSDRS